MNQETLTTSASRPANVGIRLGREYSLSIAEIFSLFQAHNFNPLIYDCTEQVLVLKDLDRTFVQWLENSGGSVKVFELPFELSMTQKSRGVIPSESICSWLQRIDLVKDYLEDALYNDKRFTFGVSTYPLSDFKGTYDDLVEYNSLIGSFLKDQFKEYGLSPGFFSPKKKAPPELSSAEVEKKGLLNTSFELVTLVGRERMVVGKTLWVQDYKRFEKRDIERPKRMPEIMTPTKLALMLLNLSLKKNSKKVLDPFCGTGTILQEALLRGLEVYGCDIDGKCVQAARENLRWLLREFDIHIDYHLKDRVVQCDVRGITPRIKKKSVDAVATEPYLGPPVRGSLSLSKAYKIVEKLTKDYTQSLKELKKVLKDDGRIVMTLPLYRIKNKEIFANIKDIIGKEFTLVNNLCDVGVPEELGFTRRGTLTYYREYQKVGREIVILEKT